MLQAYEFALEKVGVDFNSYQASPNNNTSPSLSLFITGILATFYKVSKYP